MSLQATTPGTAQTGNLNISGAGIFGGAVMAAGIVQGASNGTGDAFRVGNDAYFTDVDIANAVGIQGAQDRTKGVLYFGSANDTNLYRLAAGSLKTDGAFTAGGTLSVTGTSALTGNVGIGGASNVNQKLRVAASSTDPATTQQSIYALNSVALTAANSSSLQAVSGDLSVTGTGGSTGIVAAISGTTTYGSSGTGANINAGNFVTTQGSTGGGISTARGIYTRVDNNSTSAIQGAYGIEIGANIGTGSIVNNTGLRIGVLTGTNNAYGIQIDTPVGGTNSAAIYLSGATGAAASGILFGPDVNLYRSAANVLKTDDSLIVGINATIAGTLTVSGNATFAGYISRPGSGANSEAFGASAVASGSGSTAVGKSAQATGISSTAVGQNSLAGGNNSTVIGQGSIANGTGATAFGQGTIASAPGSITIGASAIAVSAATNAIAIGNGAISTSASSIALGAGASASAANQFVAGSDGNGINSVIFGNGVTNSAAAGFTLQATGGLGTNTAGASLSIAGGKGTGSAAGGNINLQIAAPGVAGVGSNSLATVQSVDGSTGAATFKNAVNNTTAFQIQNAGGTSLMTVDTINSKITLNQTQLNITGVPSNSLTAPGAPTLSAGAATGGTMSGGMKYYYKITSVSGAYESSPSPEASFTVPSGGGISAPTAAPYAQDNYDYSTYNYACGSSSNGCSYAYTYVTSTGETTPSPASSDFYVQDQDSITVSGISAGPAGTIARKIYVRSSSYFGTNSYYYLDTISDNTNTVYYDNGQDFWPNSSQTAPAVNTTGANTNKLNLSWTAVSGAATYKIYRGTSAGNENILVGSTASTSYTDSGSGTSATLPGSSLLPSLKVEGVTLLQTTTNISNAFQVQNAAGSAIFSVDTANTATIISGKAGGYNSAAAALYVGKDGTTNRSINASGTINATGADYAEYIPWSGAKPSQGSIVSYNGSNYVVSSQSTAAFIGNDSFDEANSILVTFAGQVPVRVTGAAHKGDLLIANGDGTAKAVNPSSATIGEILSKIAIAQEDNLDPGVKLVKASVGTTSDSMATALQNQSASFSDISVLGTATINNLNVSGKTVLASLHVTGDALVEGKLTVATIEVGTITISGHIVTKGDSPMLNAFPSLGNTGAITVDGNDTAGTITIKTGTTGINSGDLGKLIFKNSFGKAPRVILSAQDQPSQTAEIFPSSKTATDFTLKTGLTLPSNTTYTFDYVIIE